jgi:type III secretion protein V
MPRRGPAPGALFVNGFPEALQPLGLTVVPAAYAGTAKPGSIVTGSSRADLEQLGYTVWDGAQFLVLVLAAVLRAAAPAFVTAERAAGLLDRTRDYFPRLGEAVDGLVEPELLAAVLRGLLRDGIPVRNLAQVLHTLLEFRDDPPRDGGDDALAFVRGRLAAEITAKVSRGGDTVAAYLTDSGFDDAVAVYATAADRTSAESVRRAVHVAVRRVVDDLPPGASTPAILVSSARRAGLAALLGRAFPEVAVVGYQDLLSEVNVQPIDRIKVDPAGS